MLTLHDATKERHLKHALFNAKLDKIEAKQKAEDKKIADFLMANPDVGVLIKNGKKVLYRFVNGKEVKVKI